MEQRRISEGSIQEPFLRVLSMLHIVNSHYFQSTSKKLLAEYVNDEINPWSLFDANEEREEVKDPRIV